MKFYSDENILFVIGKLRPQIEHMKKKTARSLLTVLDLSGDRGLV